MELNEIESRFENCKMAVAHFGGGGGIGKGLKELMAELVRYKDLAAELQAAEAELESLPDAARELVRAGQGTAEIESRLIYLRAKREIARDVLTGAGADLESSWAEFRREYDSWLAAEVGKYSDQAAEGFRKEAGKAIEILSGCIEKLAAAEEKISGYADKKATARLRGMALFAQLAAGGLRVKLGGESMASLPRVDTGPESLRFYARLRALLNAAAGEGPVRPAPVVEVCNVLALLSVDEPATREQIK